MNEPDIAPAKPRKPPWRIVIALLVLLVIALIALAMAHPIVQEWMRNPSALIAGEDVLGRAAAELDNAEQRLQRHPNDESAHLTRARAYLTLGHLEGARLVWENQHESGGPEWGGIGRSLEELELKTDEIRALLHDAEISVSPADRYPPIYTLLDDIAERYEGIPRYRALFLKGYLLLREGRRGEAEPIFAGELENYHPLRSYVEYNYARSLKVAGREDEALAEFGEFIREFPSSRLAPLAHLERINLLRELERDDEAIVECRAALDRYPTSPFASKTLRKWAEIHEAVLDFTAGAEVRIRILTDIPDSEEAAETADMFFGGVYAPHLLEEADRLEAAYAAVWEHTSEALEILSELGDSENLSPEKRAKACHGACRCEYFLGHYYESIDWGNRARDLAPNTEWADRSGIRISWGYTRLDKDARSVEALQTVADGHGPMASVAAELLYLRAYGNRDLETVRDACTLIVEEYPASDETPLALTMLAYLGCRDGRYQSARGHAESCRTHFPDHPASAEASFWYARALEGLGSTREAREAYQELALEAPWNYWGIRARENARPSVDSLRAIDPFDFDIETLSCFERGLAVGWELYDAGILELAESEFRIALDEGRKGAQCGLALVYAEQDFIRSGILELREAAALGDQAYLTPARQQRILDELYPRPYEYEVSTAALAHDVQPSWLWGAMRQESSFNPRALSSADARGLIQIMPQTGRFIAAQRGAETFDLETLWDPALNLDFGAWYFAYLREQVGGNRLLDILAAYNGGPGALVRNRERLPTRDDDIFINAIPNEETRNFAHWVYGNIRMYEAVLEAEGYQPAPF